MGGAEGAGAPRRGGGTRGSTHKWARGEGRLSYPPGSGPELLGRVPECHAVLVLPELSAVGIGLCLVVRGTQRHISIQAPFRLLGMGCEGPACLTTLASGHRLAHSVHSQRTLLSPGVLTLLKPAPLPERGPLDPSSWTQGLQFLSRLAQEVTLRQGPFPYFLPPPVPALYGSPRPGHCHGPPGWPAWIRVSLSCLLPPLPPALPSVLLCSQLVGRGPVKAGDTWEGQTGGYNLRHGGYSAKCRKRR